MSKVYICFWFDVEDYITPASDAALDALLDLFLERGVRGTWKLVAEKLRALKQRGRADILAKLHQQDIGFHTDNHSLHPTVTEYVRALGWEAGLEAIRTREGPGLEELRREFGRISCYGQPGGAWAPQFFAFLREAGIPLYLDEGRHIGLGKQPFWFQRVLAVFNLRENCLRVSLSPEERARAKEQARRGLEEAVARLGSAGGGLLSVYYHPCEFATTEFWDGVNFHHGRNPLRSRWRPAQLLPPPEREARLELFGWFLDLALGLPGLELVDGGRLPGLYEPSLPPRPVRLESLARVAAALGPEQSYIEADGALIAPSEVFHAMAAALVAWWRYGELPTFAYLRPMQGPRTRCAAEKPVQATLEAIAEGAARALASMESGYMPAAFRVGEGEVVPATGLLLMAQAVQRVLEGAKRTDLVESPAARLLLAENVPPEEEGLWSWVIFPEGFSAPDVLELTRLQAWTMKPARLR